MVRYNRILIPFLLVLAVVLTGGCRKYEDGPLFVLKSREARVAQNWVAEVVARNEIDETDKYAIYNLTFSDNGRLNWRIQQFTDPTVIETLADWQLASNDEEIRLEFDTPDPVSGETRLLYLKLSQLTTKEMWISYTVNGDRYRARLKSI